VGSAGAGSAGTVLVDAQGHTLYRFTPESNGKIACAGGCTPTWPPLTVPSGQQLQGQGSLSGALATVQRPDGAMQATYNGWPLYRYAGDTASGTANGQGIAGKWFAVTPSVPAAGM
jgi:predicted lipoprotein with Yx(FWY)xxD motif